MRFFSTRNYKVLFVFFLLSFHFHIYAQRVASVSGPWSSTATWGGFAVPTAGQTVVINNGITVTVDMAAVCASLTVNAGNAASSVTITGTNSIAVTGVITINSGTGNGDNKTVAVGAGTLSCGSLSMDVTGGNNRINSLTISTGTATVASDISMLDNANRNQVNITSTGRLNVGGANFTGGGFTAATGSTVDYYGAAQTVRTATYHHLILSGSNTKSLGGTSTVGGNLTINNGVTFQPTADITLSLAGNLSNAGSLNADNGASQMDFTFNGAANQTVSGAGSLTEFNRITINNTGAANNNIVDILPTNLTVIPAGFLTLTQGIIKMSGNYSLTNTFFTPAGFTITINSDEGIWLNNPNVTVTAQTADISLSGLLRVTAGTFNIANVADYWLYYNSGAVVIIEGGALNVGGAFFGNPFSSTITYTQTGGTFTVNTLGNTGVFGDVPSFGIVATGSVFNMSGGTIVLQRVNDTYTDYINYSTNANVTGGTLQVGNASSPVPAFNYWINSTVPLYNLTINNTNSPTGEIRATTTVLNDVTINTGGGLDASTNNNNLFVGHDFINNGTFTQRAATVTFNGSGAQQIAGSASTTFHNFTVNKSANSLTLNRATRINGSGTFTAGIVNSTSTNLLTFSDDATTTGANNGAVPSYVNGPVRKEGNDAFTFPVGKTGAGYRFCGISAPGSTGDIFTAEFFRASASALGSISAGAAPLHHVSNCEYWDIDEDGPGSPTVDVILSWSNLSNCSILAYVNNAATLCIAHFNGTQWDSYGGLGSAVGAPWPTAGTLTWTGVNTFSPFTLGSTSALNNPLPVTLVNVKAYRNASSNKIEWTNLTESDVAVYEVQRSVNGTAFVTMSSFEARSNTSSREDYMAVDFQNSPVTYYRIKVKGIDGKVLYSPIVKVAGSNQLQADMVVYPNPVTGKQVTLQLNAVAGNYSLRVFGANGQLVKTETIIHPGGSYSKTIELPGQLPAGHYYMQVTGGEQVLNSKLIIQ